MSPRAGSIGDSPDPTVLVLNSGSSSLKFGLYRAGASGAEAVITGGAELADGRAAKFRVRDRQGRSFVSDETPVEKLDDVIDRIADVLARSNAPPPSAVGHRIVHGGPKLRHHCLIGESVMGDLQSATAFAPLHAQSALAVIRHAQRQFGGVPHAACFDTTFHVGMPDVARVLPLPKTLRAEGITRYGFHGLSCESILHQLAGDIPDRLIIAHLGNGASVTAVKAGRSIDTSMGLTPSGGMIMGTRSGDLDPGVLVYLMRENKLDAAMLEDVVNRRSGLLGISGSSSDMRRLHEESATGKDARLAIDMFCYSVRKQFGAMIAALDGVDMIVFTGGIGENDEQVRALICGGMSWAGVELNPAPGASASGIMTDPASPATVRVMASQENEQIARHTFALAAAADAAPTD